MAEIEDRRKRGPHGHDELTKALALELLADHPEEERKVVDAMPARCIEIVKGDNGPEVAIRNLALKFNDVARRNGFESMPDYEYNALVMDVDEVSPFQGDDNRCTPAFMVALVKAYGKSNGADDPFEEGLAYLKPRLGNIRKYL